MKHLATITDKDITGADGISTAEPRIAVDAILLNSNNHIALLHIGKYDTYTIPGGGVDPGEDFITAVKREILEETGYHCEIICEVGSTLESRIQYDFTQKRHYYIARAIGEQQALQLTEQELDEEITVCWYPIKEALQLISSKISNEYVLKYIQKRTVIALTEVITNRADKIGAHQ
ncbi:MAG: NUDIX hydrolase [Defluviitaleaceae bacterium]|nr:NUDIX hydrolase [Defluviitaleaceae bacterium]